MLGRPKKDRLLLDLRRQKVTSVPLLDRYNYAEARASLPEHSHAHTVEICYLARGRHTYCIGWRKNFGSFRHGLWVSNFNNRVATHQTAFLAHEKKTERTR